jgi:hypothetical protein
MKKILLFLTLFLTACAPVVTSTFPPATTAPATLDIPQVTATSKDLASPKINPQGVATSQDQPSARSNSQGRANSEALPHLPSPESNPQPAPTNVRVEDDNEYFVPRMLPFDAINPVYDPVFAPAAEAALNDDELVMGVAIDGQAKAYPVTVLQFREMVDDELAGWPILVTW